jgi:hypothetical protein
VGALFLPPGGVGSTTRAQADADNQWLPLIYMEQSHTKNRVHYDIVVDRACKPKGKAPIKVYWRMLEEDPHKTEGLTFIERVKAYGLKFQKQVQGWVHFRFAAYDKRLARVRTYKKDGRCEAELWAPIGGQQAILERFWVKVIHDKWWKLPTVPYVVAFAHDENGKAITERILN